MVTTDRRLTSDHPMPVILESARTLGPGGCRWTPALKIFHDDGADVCPAGLSLETGTAVGYTHGPFPAPENLAASLIPTGVALTWTSEKSDYGFVEYQYSMNADAAKPTYGSSLTMPVSSPSPRSPVSTRSRFVRSENQITI